MTDTVTLYALDAMGQWTGETQEVDPREGWRAPWFYAPEAPPAASAGQAALLAGETWLVVDHQGPAEPGLDQVRAAALADLAAQRWEATRYFHYDGVRTQADGAIAVITARLALRDKTGIPATLAMKFKLADGEFRLWTRSDEVAFGAAIGLYIQSCFDREDELTQEILSEADTPADIALIVDQARTSWPT